MERRVCFRCSVYAQHHVLLGRTTYSRRAIISVGCLYADEVCTLTGNVQAGANLIGGRNGLILDLCDILIDNIGMSMKDAERFLVNDFLLADLATNKGPSKFSIERCHLHILWLLGQHVLGIRTYGEFDTSHLRGRVDPIFAAKICLRVWWCLARHNLNDATSWLVQWLRIRLEMNEGEMSVSPHRLVCAALIRALAWPSGTGDSVDNVLAVRLKIPGSFLVCLARSCCGLVEALTPEMMDKVWKNTEDEKRTASTHRLSSTSRR